MARVSGWPLLQLLAPISGSADLESPFLAATRVATTTHGDDRPMQCQKVAGWSEESASGRGELDIDDPLLKNMSVSNSYFSMLIVRVEVKT